MMGYESPTGKSVFYKTDQQTLQGTSATGSTHNHTYRLKVPRQQTSGDLLPMQAWGERQLVVTDPEYDNKIRGLPSVRMHFHPANLNKSWEVGKELFKENSLVGCVGIKTETASSSPRKGSPYKRMQFIFGGNIDNTEEVAEFVKTIITHMGNICEDESVGLYKFNSKKPVLCIKNN